MKMSSEEARPRGVMSSSCEERREGGGSVPVTETVTKPIRPLPDLPPLTCISGGGIARAQRGGWVQKQRSSEGPALAIDRAPRRDAGAGRCVQAGRRHKCHIHKTWKQRLFFQSPAVNLNFRVVELSKMLNVCARRAAETPRLGGVVSSQPQEIRRGGGV